MMNIERKIEILEHKISDINEKIFVYEKFNISNKKSESLIILKNMYLEELNKLNSF